jgi:gas vesicle protein
MLVGAGIALLLAPSSGRELRAELKSRIKQLPDLLPAEPPATN